MASPTPVRVSADVLRDAKAEGERQSRSAAQQVTHWARLGRALEASDLSMAAIRAVLDGRADYDELTGTSQVAVRAEWMERIAERIEGVDLADEIVADGRTAVWVTESGQIATTSVESPGADETPNDDG